MNENFKIFCISFVMGMVVFAFGSWFISHLQRSRSFGELDSRYAIELGRAAENAGRLEEELKRERDINKQLREHNIRAGDIAAGLADTADRNVRNLQDAIGLISEIRAKLKVLEKFYSDWDSYSGSP